MIGRVLLSLLALGSLATVAGAQSPSGGAPASGERPVRESLLQRDRFAAALAWRSGFAAAMSSVLSPDGALLIEGAPLVAGRDAARLLEAQAGLAGIRVQWQPLAVLVAGDGTLGVTYGVTSMTQAGSDSSGARFAKYISVWRRQGGDWSMVAHVETALLGGLATLPAGLERRSTEAPGGGAALAFAAADLAFARMAGDSGAAPAFGAFAAPTGVIFMGTGEMVMGPAAIRARMAESRARSAWAWEPVLAGASGDGALGYTVGEATIASTVNGTTSTFYSKYLTVWRRLDDGSIRFVADAGNARPEPAAGPARP